MDNVTPGSNAPQGDESKRIVSHNDEATPEVRKRSISWSGMLARALLLTAAVAEIVMAVWTVIHPA